MENTYRDLVDYVLCNIENEKLCELSDRKYQKLIDKVAFDLLFDGDFNDYIDKTIERYTNERLKEMGEKDCE